MGELRVREIHKTVVVELIGALAPETSQIPLIELIASKISEGRRDFIFNCAGLTLPRSADVGVLVAVLVRIKDVEGSLKLCDVGTRLRGIFQVSRLYDPWRIDFSLKCDDLIRELRARDD